LDFDFSPFDDYLLSTVTENALLQLWKLPSDYKTFTKAIREPASVLKGHTRRVTSVDFHPTANNVVVTSAGDLTIRFWDIQQNAEKLKLDAHADSILSTSWNWNGSLMSSSSKDKLLKLWDPRNNKQINQVEAIDGVKGFKVCWLGAQDRLCTVGFSKGSQRQIAIWDTKKLNSPIARKEIDTGAGMMTPYYDCDTGVLFLSGKGDGNIKMFEFDETDIHYLTDYGSNIPTFGLAMIPKRTVNVKECEIDTFLKLCGDYVEPLHFYVPRTRMEFFQDDLYPPTKKINEPTTTSDEWFRGVTKEPSSISMQPSGMTKLSDAPVEKKEKKYDFKEEREKDDSQFTKEKFLNQYYEHLGNRKEGEDQMLVQDKMEGASANEWD